MQSATQDIRGFLSALMLDAARIESLATIMRKNATERPTLDRLIETLCDETSGLVARIDAARTAALMEVNIPSLAESIYDMMESRLCEEVATHIDCEEVAKHIDCEEVADNIAGEIARNHLDYDALEDALSYESLADEIDFNSLAGRLNFQRVAEHIDASDVAQHINASDVAAHIRLPDVDAKEITAKAVAAEIDLPSIASEIAFRIDTDDIVREMWQQGKCNEIVHSLAENGSFCQEIDHRVAGSLAMRIDAKDAQFISRIGQAVDVGFLASAIAHRPETVEQIGESLICALAKRIGAKQD